MKGLAGRSSRAVRLSFGDGLALLFQASLCNIDQAEDHIVDGIVQNAPQVAIGKVKVFFDILGLCQEIPYRFLLEAQESVNPLQHANPF